MLSPAQKTRLLESLPSVYEQNYRLFLRLMPHLKSLRESTTIAINGLDQLAITLREQCRYTSVLDIHYHLHANQRLLPNLELTIRIYHDARLAEVVRYQHHGRFLARYPYPNPQMYQPLEKRQINLFFRDWLVHCIKKNKLSVNSTRCG